MQLYEVQKRFSYDEIKSTVLIKKSYTLFEYKLKSKIVVYDSVYIAIHNIKTIELYLYISSQRIRLIGIDELIFFTVIFLVFLLEQSVDFLFSVVVLF